MRHQNELFCSQDMFTKTRFLGTKLHSLCTLLARIVTGMVAWRSSNGSMSHVGVDAGIWSRAVRLGLRFDEILWPNLPGCSIGCHPRLAGPLVGAVL